MHVVLWTTRKRDEPQDLSPKKKMKLQFAKDVKSKVALGATKPKNFLYFLQITNPRLVTGD